MAHLRTIPPEESGVLLPGRSPITGHEFDRACDALGVASRYRMVLRCYLTEGTIAGIAHRTGLSLATVRTYVRDLCGVLDCHAGVGAGHYASRRRMQERVVTVLAELGFQ